MEKTNLPKTKLLKKIGKYALIALLSVIVLVGGYATYFVASFTRIEDNLSIVPTRSENNYEVSVTTQYNLLNWNVGFGAYSDDFSFFMDGGKYSRGFSEEAVKKNMSAESAALGEQRKAYGEVMTKGEALIQSLNDPGQVADVMKAINELSHALTSLTELKAMFKARLEELNIVYNKETKAYEYKV